MVKTSEIFKQQKQFADDPVWPPGHSLTFTLWPQRHLLGGLGVHLLGGGSLVGHLSKDNTSVSVLCPNRSCSVTELVAPQREPGVIFLVCLSTKFDTLFIELTWCVDMLCAPPPFDMVGTV